MLRIGNAIIAAKQRLEVRFVQRWQRNRPVLVQPLRPPDTNQKFTRWVNYAAVPKTAELWTRTIGLNELIFDIDTKPWEEVAAYMRQLLVGLDELGAPHVDTFTGGKGVHVHVWLDPHALRGDAAILEKADRLGVDLWRTAREVAFGAILDAADIPRGKLRWAPPHGEGAFDRSKLRWAAGRRGSMLRSFGCVGGRGFRKTLVPEWYDWNDAPEPSAEEHPRLRFPDWKSEEAWKMPEDLRLEWLDAVAVEVARIEKRREAADAKRLRIAKPSAQEWDEGERLARVPCAERIFKQGPPHTGRHFAGLMLASAAFALGYTKGEARALMRGAIDANPANSAGAEMNMMETVNEVYSGRWKPAKNCPDGRELVPKSWCCKTECVFAPNTWEGAK